MVEGEVVGRVEGFRFLPEPSRRPSRSTVP